MKNLREGEIEAVKMVHEIFLAFKENASLLVRLFF